VSDERAAAVSKLRAVGGVYDYVADFVERDRLEPPPGVESRHEDNP
jgi:hypothetical protein